MNKAASVNRLSYRVDEAAESYGVSKDWIEDHVLPEVRWVRQGRMKLIPVAELERYLDEHARRPDALLDER
jgi:hypothetical protein